MGKFHLIRNLTKDDAAPIGVLENGDVVGLAREDMIGLTYIFGKAGQGRSVTFENLAISDIFFGRGGLLIDPYGNVADDIQPYVPKKTADKVGVFEMNESSLEANIKRLEKDWDMNEMKKDPGKFLLCKLRSRTVDPEAADAFGRHLIKKFFAVVGADGDLSGRSLYVDEAKHYLDDEIWAQIARSRESRLRCTLADQFLDEPAAAKAKPLLENGQLLCYNIDETWAKAAAEAFGLGTDGAADILATPKFHFLARLTVGGVVQPAVRLKSIYPVGYPRGR
jgi:hypothetical protein